MPRLTLSPRIRTTPYHESVLSAGVTDVTIYNRMVMPTSYGDNVRDYWSLVNDVTLWDVTCQKQIQITGPDAYKLIEFLTPRDMSGCEVGMCQYILLTDENGGIVNISKTEHGYTPMKGAIIQSSRPSKTLPHWIGNPLRISCSTPEREVKGVAPVKFIAI